MLFEDKEIKMTHEIIKRKIGTVENIDIIIPEKRYSEAKIYSKIKTNIKKFIVDISKLNSLTILITKSLINYTKKIIPESNYIGLKEYSKISNIRMSAIKKILGNKGYMVGHYPTNKSYRASVVFSTYHKYKNSMMDKRIDEILILWKKDFLDRMLRNNQEEIVNLNEQYSYNRPRTTSECFNMITLHYEFIFRKTLNNNNLLDEFSNIKGVTIDKNIDKNLSNRFNILKKYIQFYLKNYVILS
jgi:hypothetical protein